MNVLLPGAKKAQLVPAPRASVGAKSRQIRGSDDGEFEILNKMMSHAVRTVEPGGAHRTRLGLPFSEHEVIDDERAVGLGEKPTEADGARRRITS